MLKQRLDFRVRKLLNFMERLALNQGQKTAETTLRYLIKRMIQSMHRLALIQGEKIFERTVRISGKETI